jgi:hypothetical protein
LIEFVYKLYTYTYIYIYMYKTIYIPTFTYVKRDISCTYIMYTFHTLNNVERALSKTLIMVPMFVSSKWIALQQDVRLIGLIFLRSDGVGSDLRLNESRKPLFTRRRYIVDSFQYSPSSIIRFVQCQLEKKIEIRLFRLIINSAHARDFVLPTCFFFIFYSI